MREYLATVTRMQPCHVAVPIAEAIEGVRFFAQHFDLVEDGPNVRELLLPLLAPHHVAGKQMHDANVVATMLANGLTRLLPFNVVDFHRFAGLITVKTP